MNARPARVVVAILLACLVAAWLLQGCGSEAPHLPQVTTGVGVGPKPHEATISLRSSGGGYGVAEFVLTYPDGHMRVEGAGVLEDGTSLGWTRKQLPSGHYECTFYAVPTATPPMAPDFPAGATVDKNVIDSEAFVID